MDTENKTIGSETLLFTLLLTFSGGYIDSYSYINRDGVFANAQTGNIVKLGINIAEGNIYKSLRYFIPIVSFIIGVFIALSIKEYCQKKHLRIYKRMILLIECLLCVLISFIPDTHFSNIFANILISFFCALRMETFKKLHGLPVVTTISTGNLRSCVEHFFEGHIHKNSKSLLYYKEYLVIVIMFITGAVMNVLISKYLGIQSILISIIPILMSIYIITFHMKKLS